LQPNQEEWLPQLSKRQLFRIALKRGLYLPPPTDSVTDIYYLRMVIEGCYWVPRYADVQVLPAHHWPLLKQEICKMIELELLA
jgi:hypothetical protein